MSPGDLQLVAHPPETDDSGQIHWTPRLQEVARHVAQGRTNREIAQQLYISERTVEDHVSRILHRAGYKYRRDIATWTSPSEAVLDNRHASVPADPTTSESVIGQDAPRGDSDIRIETRRIQQHGHDLGWTGAQHRGHFAAAPWPHVIEALPDGTQKTSVLMTGDWAAMPSAIDLMEVGWAQFRRVSNDLRSLKQACGNYHPSWLLVGLGMDEWHVRAVTRAAKAVLPNISLSMLGSLDDPNRYERWLRQGCRVYVQSDCSARRMAALLHAAAQSPVTLVDSIFQEKARARLAEPATSLTRREAEVLQLVGRGLRNIDVARALHIAERTVEFHLSRLLVKFGARNRVEAVERATSLGLL
jgi:DNA-binding NarL/FixJ family response regulator